MADKYSTKEICEELKDEIATSMQNIEGWGSVEIFIQGYKVTQITEKNIKKPSGTGEE